MRCRLRREGSMLGIFSFFKRLIQRLFRRADHPAAPSTHAPREDKGTIALRAGKSYNIKLEYYDQQYGAVMKLLWSSASTAKQVIPQSQLFSSTPVASPAPPPAPVVGAGNGLLATYFDNA